jgi:energy-coupling factor transporter ATP-binding protein EcfA2
MTEIRKVLVQPLHLVEGRRLEWVWEDMIPEQTLTLLAGTAGIGKSTILAWITGALTRGELEGAFKGKPIAVGFVAAEDDLKRTLIPRLDAARANRELVTSISLLIERPNEEYKGLPTIANDLSALEAQIIENGIRVLIVDPVVSVMDGDSVKLSDVRRNLDRLSALGERTGCTIIAVTHFNKGSGNASEKITGSSAFRDTARSVLLLAVDEDSDQRILTVDKSNYSPVKKSLAFSVRSVIVPVEDGETSVGCAELLGETALRVHDLVGNLSEDKLAILALAKDAKEEAERGARPSSTITSEQVMEELKISANTARQKLNRMVKDGHLQRVRDGEFSLAAQGWQAPPSSSVTRNAVTPVTPEAKRQAPTALQRDTVTPLHRDSHPLCPTHSAPTRDGHCAQCELELAS